MSPRISMIVAVSKNGVIGDKGMIPWHIREDLRRFRSMTEGKTVIVGRNTFEQLKEAYFSRGKPLPDRNHVVVTRDRNYIVDIPKCFVCYDTDSALRLAGEIEKEEVFVSGGSSIFSSLIEKVDRLYLTLVDIEVEGDARFVDYSAFTKVMSEESREDNGIKFRYLTLERL